MNRNEYTPDAFLVVTVCLYSTGHWIGGTIALVFAVLSAVL